jgi:hypothetical protein
LYYKLLLPLCLFIRPSFCFVTLTNLSTALAGIQVRCGFHMTLFASSSLKVTTKSVGLTTQCVCPRLRYRCIPLAWHQNWVILSVRWESLAFKSTRTHNSSRRVQKCSQCVYVLTCTATSNITVCEYAKYPDVGLMLCQYLHKYLCCTTRLRKVLLYY